MGGGESGDLRLEDSRRESVTESEPRQSSLSLSSAGVGAAFAEMAFGERERSENFKSSREMEVLRWSSDFKRQRDPAAAYNVGDQPGHIPQPWLSERPPKRQRTVEDLSQQVDSARVLEELDGQELVVDADLADEGEGFRGEGCLTMSDMELRAPDIASSASLPRASSFPLLEAQILSMASLELSSSQVPPGGDPLPAAVGGQQTYDAIASHILSGGGVQTSQSSLISAYLKAHRLLSLPRASEAQADTLVGTGQLGRGSEGGQSAAFASSALPQRAEGETGEEMLHLDLGHSELAQQMGTVILADGGAAERNVRQQLGLQAGGGARGHENGNNTGHEMRAPSTSEDPVERRGGGSSLSQLDFQKIRSEDASPQIGQIADETKSGRRHNSRDGADVKIPEGIAEALGSQGTEDMASLLAWERERTGGAREGEETWDVERGSGSMDDMVSVQSGMNGKLGNVIDTKDTIQEEVQERDRGSEAMASAPICSTTATQVTSFENLIGSARIFPTRSQFNTAVGSVQHPLSQEIKGKVKQECTEEPPRLSRSVSCQMPQPLMVQSKLEEGGPPPQPQRGQSHSLPNLPSTGWEHGIGAEPAWLRDLIATTSNSGGEIGRVRGESEARVGDHPSRNVSRQSSFSGDHPPRVLSRQSSLSGDHPPRVLSRQSSLSGGTLPSGLNQVADTSCHSILQSQADAGEGQRIQESLVQRLSETSPPGRGQQQSRLTRPSEQHPTLPSQANSDVYARLHQLLTASPQATPRPTLFSPSAMIQAHLHDVHPNKDDDTWLNAEQDILRLQQQEPTAFQSLQTQQQQPQSLNLPQHSPLPSGEPQDPTPASQADDQSGETQQIFQAGEPQQMFQVAELQQARQHSVDRCQLLLQHYAAQQRQQEIRAKGHQMPQDPLRDQRLLLHLLRQYHAASAMETSNTASHLPVRQWGKGYTAEAPISRGLLSDSYGVRRPAPNLFPSPLLRDLHPFSSLEPPGQHSLSYTAGALNHQLLGDGHGGSSPKPGNSSTSSSVSGCASMSATPRRSLSTVCVPHVVRLVVDGHPGCYVVTIHPSSDYLRFYTSIREALTGCALRTPAKIPQHLPDSPHTVIPGGIVAYEDDEGDLLLVGDIPWRLFFQRVKKIRVVIQEPG